MVGGSNPLVPTIYIFIVTVILLTNDDGVESEGLRTLEKALEGLARLVIVAPDRERSGVSHGLTIHSSLEAKKLEEDIKKKHEDMKELPTIYFTQLLAIALGLDRKVCRFDLNPERVIGLLEKKGLMEEAS